MPPLADLDNVASRIQVSEDGNNALHWALLGCHDDGQMVQVLLGLGVNTEQVNDMGFKPIDYAQGTQGGHVIENGKK